MSMNNLPGYTMCNGYWKLSDGTDISGKGRALTTVAGAPTYVPPGKFATNGLLIDAAEGVTALTGTPINCDADFTVGIWYKPAALVSGTTYYMMDNRSVVSGIEYIILVLQLSGTTYSFGGRASNPAPTLWAFPTSPVGTWHLFGASGEAATNLVRYYVDGKLVVTETGGTATIATAVTTIAYSTSSSTGQLGTYGTAWTEPVFHDEQWWRRTYAWFTGKLV